MQNSPSQVVAKAPGADIFMLLEIVEMPQGRNVQEVALNQMQGANFRQVEGNRTTINGLDAYLGVYQGALEGLGNVAMRAAHIAYGTNYFMVAGLVPPQGFQQADGAFTTSIRSFRSMTAAEAENIHPNRVDLYVVRAGDTWASIAERSGGVITPATLAVMNKATPGSTPPVGTRIKIVVSG